MICGFDEAGRGPLAGPVCAAGVILPREFPWECLGDSKRLSREQREQARSLICDQALAWGIGWASHEEIDRINILQASLLAMQRAFEDLRSRLQGIGLEQVEAIVDGISIPDLPIPCQAMIKADSRIPEVMAASILAKTARDQKMEAYAQLYPEYGYEKHKGYPTQGHREKIALYGPSPIQRRSFKVKGADQGILLF